MTASGSAGADVPATPEEPGRPAIASVESLDELDPALDGLARQQPVVVLIGGAAALEHSDGDRLLPLIRDGIIAAAAAAGATIVDGGTDSGVMALAGRARVELASDVALIGVAPRARSAVPEVAGADGLVAPEPNHTRVLLVPGEEWGEESPWLLEVARRLAGDRPVVAVVVDGGPVAMSEALDCAEAGWPVVAVSGSGRSADVLARRSGIISYPLAGGPAGLAAMLRGLLLGEVAPLAGGGTTAQPGAQSPASIEYPALYAAASEAAKRGQRMHRRLTLIEIALSSAGLLIALAISWFFPPPATSPGGPDGRVIAVVAFFFVAGLIVKLLNRSTAFDRSWYAGRGVAEAAKSLAWRYMIRVRPYHEPDADRRFRIDMASLLRRSGGFTHALHRLPDRPQQITDSMRAVRSLGLLQRRDTYLTRRVYDQAGWYRRRGASYQRWAAWAFWSSVGLQLAAAGIAVWSLVVGVDLLRPMAALGAIALAVTAWSQANRFDELGGSYAAGVQELLLIAAVAEGSLTDESVEDLVLDAEEAIGREHRQWLARHGPSPAAEEEIEDDAE